MENIFSAIWIYHALFVCTTVICGFIIHALPFLLAYNEEYDTKETKDIVLYLMASTCFFIPYQMGKIALYIIQQQ